MRLLDLKYIPEKFCIYGDSQIGKTFCLVSNYNEFLEEASLFLDRYSGEDLSGVDYLFVDTYSRDLDNLCIPYLFTTSLTPLEGYYNFPLYSRTRTDLLISFPEADDMALYTLGSVGVLHTLDTDFKEYWKGFCKVIFNYNQNTMVNALKYLETFEKSRFPSWLLFLKLVIEKGTSNYLVLARIKTFSTYMLRCLEKIELGEFKDMFVEGIYSIYNSLNKFPYRDKLNKLLDFVD